MPPKPVSKATTRGKGGAGTAATKGGGAKRGGSTTEKKKTAAEKVVPEAEKKRPGIDCTMKQLIDLLIKDVDNRIKDSGKWPMIVDPSEQAITFLRYQEVIYFNSVDRNSMEPDKLRLGLLGALLYGKAFVIDMMDVDMFPTCYDQFDLISNGLLKSIMDRSFLKPENYEKLIKSTDGEEYNQPIKYLAANVEAFKFFLVVKNPNPSDQLLNEFTPVWIVIS